MKRRGFPQVLVTLVWAALASPVVFADPASQLVVLLPGQALGPGGVTGTPTIEQREPFTVEVYAVDAFGNIDFDYEGPIVGVATGESQPTAGVRMATLVSGGGGATSLPPGSEIRLAINGEDYRDYGLAAAATGDEVCQAFEGAVANAAPGALSREISFDCTYTQAHYIVILGDERPARSNLDGHYLENTLEIDPDFGVAPLLHFDSPSGFIARRLVQNPAIDHVFHRGVAAFRLTWSDLADAGPGKAVTVDQGSGPALPVLAGSFEVEPAAFKVQSATALGDGNGRINRVRLGLNMLVDPDSLAGQAGNFTLEWVGTPVTLPGTGLALVDAPPLAHPHDTIEVTFGTGIGKTDIQDIQVIYTPPASGFIRSESGSPLQATTPPLKDGAPPVLIGTFPQDTDQNGGLDLLRLIFSEEIKFSAGRGVSLSAYDVPGAAPLSLDLPASLHLVIDGDEATVPIVDPDGLATTLDGGEAIARAVTYAVRSSLNRPAYANFICEFSDGRKRLVLVSGSVGDGSKIEILSAAANDAAPVLRLGTANGGVERQGQANGIADLDDWVILAEDGRHSLLEGLGGSSFAITGSVLEVGLTNVPNTGTATPAYVWKDDGDLAFLTDRAKVPNRATGSNNVGLSADFHPSELIRIRDTDSAPDDGTVTSPPGVVELDSTPSTLPLLATHDPAELKFLWTQLEGPKTAAIDSPDEPLTDTELLTAGTYVFQLVVTALGSGGTRVFSSDLTAEGTLSHEAQVKIVPGPSASIVVLLPGQSLNEGSHTLSEAVQGTYLATPGVPFEVRVTCTDSFFNVVDCPAGSVSLETTEPGALITPLSQPLSGSEVSFTVHPTTPGDWQIDDLPSPGLSDAGDAPVPYATGTAWLALASKLPGLPASIHLTWVADPRPVKWNVYAGSLPIGDLDKDGLPDDGYGTCASASDPDPHDTVFDDTTVPPSGAGLFYVGTMTLGDDETVPGTTSAGKVGAVGSPCP